MGRTKTRKKNQRDDDQPFEDQDPDVSEAETSTATNASSSLNDTVTLNSNNVMDTDAEDSEQASPVDELDSGSVNGTVETLMGTLPVGEGKVDIVGEELKPSESEAEAASSAFDDQPQTSQQELNSPCKTCPHIKGSVSMPGVRKSLKSLNSVCSGKLCAAESAKQEESGDESVSSKELWFCLQCGHVGCGDHNALNGDAETHCKTPRSDQHNLALRIGGETDICWCYSCQTFVNTKNSSIKDVIQFAKRHPKLRLSLQEQSKNKTASTPIIALGPPPPPPQPDTEVVKSLLTTNKRNKITPYSSNWDNGSRDWPLGLENLGNTCFMNSALQCLSRTRSLHPKLDLYGTGNVIEIQVTADPPSVKVLGLVSSDSNVDADTSVFHMSPIEGDTLGEENGDTNHVFSGTTETGGSSPSSSEMDSLLDVASGTSSKSSPSKEVPQEIYRAEIENELKRCLRLKLVIPKESMTWRLRHAFKAMSRNSDAHSGAGSGSHSTEYFGRGRHVFTPSAIHHAMARHFRPGQQHDSHELLRTVVDMMKKDQIKAFRLAIMESYGIKKSEGKNCDPKIAELLKMWDRKLYHKTFVDEIFGGELVTFQTCLTCNSVRKSHEDFLDLSLPIRLYSNKNAMPKRTYSIFDDDGDGRSRSVEDCLKSFTEAEQLTGSNVVECENCHRINLQRLDAGESFEDVFPGVKPPAYDNNKKETEPPVETEMDALEPLLMEEEAPQEVCDFGNSAEDMDDLDEPAVDGIGNTSDMEDEGNDVPPLFLGESEDKGMSDFLNAAIPKETVSLSLAASGTQDEGFSESDSSEEKKSASISASSSRNSISETENGTTQRKSNVKQIPITKCPCSRQQMVWRPPECLTIHLKRFQITSHGTSKLSDRVNFPFILNLTPFCAPHGEELENVDGKDIYDEDGEVKYALYGIVEHSGSLHWGHYVAYIKVHGENEGGEKPSSEPSRDKWFYISDSSVSPSSLESVLGMDPYILFYERIRGQDKKEKLEHFRKLTNPSFSSTDNCESTAAAPINNCTTTANYSLY